MSSTSTGKENCFTTPSSSCKQAGGGRSGRNSSQKSATTSVAVTPSRLKCISDLKGELTCGICLDICVKPCSTPCGHNFCQRCLQALYRTSCANSQKTFVECPKCRKSIGKIDEINRRLQHGSVELEVNSALWNVIQLLFPHVELKSPQWKLKQATPTKHQNRGMGIGMGPPTMGPLAEEEESQSDFLQRARLMLQLTTTMQQEGLDSSAAAAAANINDEDDEFGGFAPVLDMNNLRPAMREVFFNSNTNTNTNATEAETGAQMLSGQEGTTSLGGSSEHDAVPRAGFTTAREILMRTNTNPSGVSEDQQVAPHEIIEYA